MTERCRIGIVGAGAIGSLLAVRLSKVADIVIFAKCKTQKKVLEKTGFHLIQRSSKKILQSNTNAKIVVVPDTSIKPLDAIFVTVKANNTDAACKVLENFQLMENTAFVLTFQNGIGSSALLEASLGRRKVLRGVTYMGSSLASVGCAVDGGKGETIVAQASSYQQSKALRRIQNAFVSCDMPMKIVSSQDMDVAIWSKLLVNAAINPIASMLDCTNGRVFNSEGSRLFARNIVYEGIQVANASGIYNFEFEETMARIENVAMATRENICSMLYDIRQNRSTEIDFLNGAIVRGGEMHGIKTPVNAAVSHIIQRLKV